LKHRHPKNSMTDIYVVINIPQIFIIFGHAHDEGKYFLCSPSDVNDYVINSHLDASDISLRLSMSLSSPLLNIPLVRLPECPKYINTPSVPLDLSLWKSKIPSQDRKFKFNYQLDTALYTVEKSHSWQKAFKILLQDDV
jgi:hypothetical protein